MRGSPGVQRAAMCAFGIIGLIAVVVAGCAPPPSDPGSPPTTLEPLPDPPGEFSVLSYNVAGLPLEVSKARPDIHLPMISPLLNAYDVVATQEDFDWWQPVVSGLDFVNYHTRLRADATHPYRTDRHPGPVAVGIDPSARPLVVGDGIGLMARYPLTNVVARAWTGCNGGPLPDGGASDCLAMKGFRVATMTLGDGLSVDVYSVHGEAGNTAVDQQLQALDFVELATFINDHSDGRAVIVAGDTNLHTDLVHPDGGNGLDIAIWQEFLASTGLTDSCTALECADPGGIDKIAFRGGGGISLTALTHDLPTERFSGPDGEPLSDHPPVVVRFGWDLLDR